MFFFLNVIVLLLHFFTDFIADGFENYPWGNHVSPGKYAIYTNSVLSLLPIMFSLWFIAVETKKTESNDRRASLLFLFFGTTIAWSISGYSNIFYKTLFDSTEHIRLASSASIIQTLFIIPALLKYNFLHKPIASIYHDLFNHSPDGVLITDSGGQIIKSNKIALEIIDGASNVNQLFDSKQFSIKSEYSNKEFHLLAGQTISLSQSKIMQGTLELGMLLIVRDITENKVLEQEQKEIEERYRLLVESSPDGVMLHNTQEVLFINEAALKLLGAPNKDVIIGRNPNSFIHDDYLEMENERTEKILNGESLDPIYEKMLRIDGTEVMVEAKGVLTHLEGKPVIQTTIRDVSQRIKAENEIKKSHDEIRKLAIHLQNLQEDERGQIAKEIHDELGQTLTGIKMDLSFLQQINDDESVCERLEVVDGLVDRTIKTVRKISSGLHPPVLDDLGLKAAIEWQTQEFFARSKINYVLDLPDYNIEFSKDKSRAIFRIIQESLTNVARHSNATTVTITSKVDNQNMIFSITDDGIGISQSVINENSTFGIISMKERALVFDGEVEITGNNKGTLVKLTIPLEKIGS